MRRRRFLAALGGTASLGLGGLLAYRSSRTRTLSVASVDTYDAAFRLQDEHHRREIRPVESLEPAPAAAVEAAVDGGYETSSPSAEAGEFLDRTQFVRYRDQPYRLSDTFPGIVVTAEPTDGETAGLEVATAEQFQERVPNRAGRRPFLVHARRGGVVDRTPTPDVEAFFEQYDAVRYGGRTYAFSVERRGVASPYTLTAEPVSEQAVRDARTVPIDDLSPTAREQIRAVEPGDRSVHGLDASPAVVDSLRAKAGLRMDGNLYHLDAWSLAHVPLSMSATVTEPGVGFKDPGRLRLTLSNVGERDVRFHRVENPFGTLQYRPVDGGTDRYLYDETGDSSSWFWSTGHVSHGPREATLAAGQQRSVEFDLGGDAVGVPAGRYEIAGAVDATGWFRGQPFPFRVVIDLG